MTTATQNIATFDAAQNTLRDLRIARKSKITSIHEGDTSMATEFDRKIDAASKACAIAERAVKADTFAAEWTLEVTKTRRADWNAWVAKVRPTTFSQKLDQEAKCGFKLEAMKSAIAHHNL